MPATCRSLKTFTIALLLSATCCLTVADGGEAIDRDVGCQSGSKSVYLVRHGWHTSLVFKRAEISSCDWPESQQIPAACFVEVGWGDEAYLKSGCPNPLVLANAACLPSRSALHVTAIRDSLGCFFPKSQIVRVKLSACQMRKLCRFIHDSYAHNDCGCPIRVAPAIYGAGSIYRADGCYYLPKSCNVWTAKALEAAGCPVAVPLCTLATPLMLQAKAFGCEIKKGSKVPAIYPFLNFHRPPKY